MTARRFVLALVVTLLPMSAFAQLDDLLSPLTPKQEAPKHKPKKRRRHPRAKKEKKEKKPAKAEDPMDLIAPLVPVKGELLVKVLGPNEGAVITVDGQPAQEGKKVSLEAGEHTVVVKRPGYSDYSKKVSVTAGKATEVSAALEAVAGVLTVNADVPGATVVLDGTALGEVPIRGALLPPGMHEVIVRKEGFEDEVSRISVRAGRDYTVKGTMKPKEGYSRIVASSGDRPERTQLVPDELGGGEGPDPLSISDTRVDNDDWYKRWYVWAGAGAVVIAAATTAVVASSSAGGHKLTPGEVCDLDPNDGQPGTCDDVINAPAALLRLGAGFGMRF